MKKLLLWWITVLDHKTPAEAAMLALIWIAVSLIVIWIGRVIWQVWHYTPEPEERAPRAAGINHRRVS